MTTPTDTIHVLVMDEAGSPEILAAYMDRETAKLYLLDLWLQDQAQADPDLGPDDLLFALHEDSDDRWEAEMDGVSYVIQPVHVQH